MKAVAHTRRAAALGLLFLVTTGQASTDGCAEPQDSATSLPAAQGQVADAQPAAAYRVDEVVSIEWRGGWYPGRILDVGEGRYLVRYDGFGAEWDEWVAADRLRGSGSATAAPPPAAPPPSAAAPGGGATTPTAAGLHGTWQYESWTTPGRGELMNQDVFYWLTLRPNGSWSLSNTTRWSPNSPDFIAGGSYSFQGGRLVLTQSGTPARTYGQYRVEQSAADRITLREADGGDVIVLRRGRG